MFWWHLLKLMNLTEISTLHCVLQDLLRGEEVGIFILFGFIFTITSSWSIIEWHTQSQDSFFHLSFKFIPPNFFHLPLLLNVVSLSTLAGYIAIILGINVCGVRFQLQCSPVPVSATRGSTSAQITSRTMASWPSKTVHDAVFNFYHLWPISESSWL